MLGPDWEGSPRKNQGVDFYETPFFHLTQLLSLSLFPALQGLKSDAIGQQEGQLH